MAHTLLEHVNTLSISDLIAKKRDGQELDADEIRQFINGLSNGDVQDCHVGAMLMAIFIRGENQTDLSREFHRRFFLFRNE